MKYLTGDKVVALSGDYAHQTGIVIAVGPVASGRSPTAWIYRVRFQRGSRWLSETALRPPYKHEAQDGRR